MFDIFEEYYFSKQLIANEIQKRNNYLSKKYPHTFSDISTYANLLDKNLIETKFQAQSIELNVCCDYTMVNFNEINIHGTFNNKVYNNPKVIILFSSIYKININGYNIRIDTIR